MGDYDPNSFTAVLSRLDTSVSSVVNSVEALRMESQAAYKRLHERLDSHDTELNTLRTAEAVRKREQKWAVAAIAAMGWGINAFIAWVRGS
jgi:hypothetical protein